MTTPLGVVLAGGKASRMGGGDKCFLPLKSRLVLDHVIERLIEQVPDIVINANGDLTRFKSFEHPSVSDSIVDFPGPLAGVLAGLDWAATRGYKYIVTVAADTPFFPLNLLDKLEEAKKVHNMPIGLSATLGSDDLNLHPTFGLWPVDLREDLRTELMSGMRKVVQWTERHFSASVSITVISAIPTFAVKTHRTCGTV